MTKMRPTCLRVLGVLLALLAATAAFSPPASATAYVHLSATVTNTDGVPQKGFVYLQRVGSNEGSGTGLANGVWSYDWDADVQTAGDYLIYVSSSTMDGTQRFYQQGNPAGTTDKAQATPVHLGPGAPDLAFSMVMPAIGTLSGKVVDSSNVGVPGLQVILNEQGTLRWATTGAGGAFDFGYTQAGSWQVTVAGGQDYLNVTRSGVVVPASGSMVMPDVTVQRASSIEGVVTDSVTGNPVPFVEVVVYAASSHAQIGMPVTTDASGHYRIGRLGTAPFVLRFLDEVDVNHGYAWTLNDGGDPNDFSPQTPITLAEGESRVHDEQLVLKPAIAPPAHTLSGTVTDTSGRPLVGVDVTTGELTSTTDRRGQWFLDAPDGSHVLRYSSSSRWLQIFGSAPGWAPAYFPGTNAASAATAVTVTGGTPVGGLDMVLRRAGRITGALVVPGGVGLDEHEIWVYDAAGALVSHQDMDSGAAYSVDVPAGVPVHLVARGRVDDDPMVEYLPRWYGDVDSFASSTPIQVTGGATSSGKDVHLTDTALANLTPPEVAGAAAPGSTLSATPGTWSVETMTRYATTWLRDGVAVGSGPTYTVGTADAGSALAARVTATNGSVVAHATSAPVAVAGPAQAVPTAMVGRGTSPRAGEVKIVITLSAPGMTPSGTLTIRRGAQVVKRAVTLANGRATVLLRKQPAGTRRYVVSYSGSVTTLPQATTVRVKVR